MNLYNITYLNLLPPELKRCIDEYVLISNINIDIFTFKYGYSNSVDVRYNNTKQRFRFEYREGSDINDYICKERRYMSLCNGLYSSYENGLIVIYTDDISITLSEIESTYIINILKKYLL